MIFTLHIALVFVIFTIILDLQYYSTFHDSSGSGMARSDTCMFALYVTASRECSLYNPSTTALNQ